MKIDGNFKAFSSLSISSLPKARFVILVGPNGSGKSSVFDAMLYWASRRGRPVVRSQPQDYFAHPDNTMANDIELTFHESDEGVAPQQIHVRSAYRFTPQIRTTSLEAQPSLINQPVVSSMMDQDSAVMRHYQTLVGQFVRLLSDLDDDSGAKKAKKQLAPLRAAVSRMFPDLELQSLGNALSDGSFFFNKKNVKNFRYDNLSSGEKAAFDLLLDLHLSGKEFAEGIICLDEPETHLSPRVQAALLDAIADLVPSTCQIWIATHSVGLLRRALELHQQSPDAVVFLSFNDLVAGSKVTIEPAKVDRAFWRTSLAVALDDLAALIAPEVVYLCEGNTSTNKDSTYAWDARIYRQIFNDTYPQIDFVSVGGQAELKAAGEIAMVVAKGSTRIRLRDRDSLTNVGRQELLDADPNLRVLQRRSLENYLVDDEVIAKLVAKYELKVGRTLAEITEARDEALANSSKDDLAKTALSAVYEMAKQVLQRNGQLGENTMQFARDVLAPLVTSETAVYAGLKQSLGLT